MKFRIKEETNKVNGAVRYIPQVKFLFWWNTMEDYTGDIICNTESEAKRIIKERKIKAGWQ